MILPLPVSVARQVTEVVAGNWQEVDGIPDSVLIVDHVVLSTLR